MADGFQQLGPRGGAGGEALPTSAGSRGSARVLDAGPWGFLIPPSWSGLALIPPLDCPALWMGEGEGGTSAPGSAKPVYMGECLVCLAFGCLLPRVLMGPWC